MKVAPTKKAKLDDYFATRESDVEEEAESELLLSALPVKELRRRLNECGVAHGDCIEKSDLVDRLISILGIASASNSRADNRRDSTFDEENVAAGMKRTEEKASEEALNAEMFPEQIDVLTESEDWTDMNNMLLSRNKINTRTAIGHRRIQLILNSLLELSGNEEALQWTLVADEGRCCCRQPTEYTRRK